LVYFVALSRMSCAFEAEPELEAFFERGRSPPGFRP
jgi:hypothetical protein